MCTRNTDKRNAKNLNRSAGKAFSWEITFNGATHFGEQPKLAFVALLTGTGAAITVVRVKSGASIGGHFRLSYQGVFTRLISATATDVEVQTAIEVDLGLIQTEVTRQDPTLLSGGGYSWTAVFTGVSGRIPLLGVDESSLTGTAASAVVTSVSSYNRIGGGFTLSFKGMGMSFCSFILSCILPHQLFLFHAPQLPL